MKRKSSSNIFLWIIVSLLGVFLFFSIMVNMGLLAALMGKKATGPNRQRGTDEFPELVERLSYGSGPTKVARISFSGIITRESDQGLFSLPIDRVEATLQQIRAAQNDQDVEAIIFEIDSPGGAITPSDELYHALQGFKQSHPGRKVIIFVRDMAASGGYYMAAAGDWIISEPTAIVGSIGVILQTLNWKILSEKIGVTDTTIVSGKNKDMLNPFKEVSPEQLELLQLTVDTLYNRFFYIVQQSRDIETDKLRSLADGRILVAEDALQNGLIDEIGYWGTVLERTRVLLDKDNISIIRYEHYQSFFSMLAQARNPISIQSFQSAQTPRFMYLWKP